MFYSCLSNLVTMNFAFFHKRTASDEYSHTEVSVPTQTEAQLEGAQPSATAALQSTKLQLKF